MPVLLPPGTYNARLFLLDSDVNMAASLFFTVSAASPCNTRCTSTSCLNGGVCNSASGLCVCEDYFFGYLCERGFAPTSAITASSGIVQSDLDDVDFMAVRSDSNGIWTVELSSDYTSIDFTLTKLSLGLRDRLNITCVQSNEARSFSGYANSSIVISCKGNSAIISLEVTNLTYYSMVTGDYRDRGFVLEYTGVPYEFPVWGIAVAVASSVGLLAIIAAIALLVAIILKRRVKENTVNSTTTHRLFANADRGQEPDYSLVAFSGPRGEALEEAAFNYNSLKDVKVIPVFATVRLTPRRNLKSG
jgi:hypothetical protein